MTYNIIRDLTKLNKTIRKELLDTVDIHKIIKKMIKDNPICKECPFTLDNKKVVTNAQEHLKRKTKD